MIDLIFMTIDLRESGEMRKTIIKNAIEVRVSYEI